MRKAIRIGLIVAGVVLLAVIGGVVFLALVFNDTITFSKRTQSIELPHGRVLNIYRISKSECYECRFELLDQSGKVLIPKTYFYLYPYLTTRSAARVSTPEARTTFLCLVGKESGVVGLVSAEEEGIVSAVIDPARVQYVAPKRGAEVLSETGKALGIQLVSALQADLPDQPLALEGTEAEAKLRRIRHGTENLR